MIALWLIDGHGHEEEVTEEEEEQEEVTEAAKPKL